MTTPRDDIAGLSEGLRIYAKHAMPCFPNDLCSKGATQLDSLLKERDALQARVKELEGYVLDEQLSHSRTAKAAREGVARLQEERADEWNRRREAENQRDVAKAAADTLRQERDEAIKLIRPLTILAEDTARVSSKHGSEFAPEMSSLAARARSFVRRLADPEKEKKK